MKLFVFGAGYSARAAIARVRAMNPGAEIAATTRDADKAEALRKEGVECRVWDGAGRDAAVEAALSGTTHLLISIAPDKTGDRVLEAFGPALAGAGALQWIGYYSTIGVYGNAESGWVDETVPVVDAPERIAWRVKAESDWRALARDRGIPAAVFRLAGIYGPGRSAFDKLRAGTARRIVKPGQVFNRIHREDIGKITARAAIERLEGIYNLADDLPAPPQDLILYAAGLMGIDPPPEIPFDEAELSPMARSFYANNRRVSNGAIKAALGYRLLYPDYKAGLEAIFVAEKGEG